MDPEIAVKTGLAILGIGLPLLLIYAAIVGVNGDNSINKSGSELPLDIGMLSDESDKQSPANAAMRTIKRADDEKTVRNESQSVMRLKSENPRSVLLKSDDPIIHEGNDQVPSTRKIDPTPRYPVIQNSLEKPTGQIEPKKVTTSSSTFERSQDVKAWVLQSASGICECCEEPAPFTTKGVDYLEVHHVRPLAEGGSDTPQNAVAICPNCHKALHHSDNKAVMRERLYASVARLVRE